MRGVRRGQHRRARRDALLSPWCMSAGVSSPRPTWWCIVREVFTVRLSSRDSGPAIS